MKLVWGVLSIRVLWSGFLLVVVPVAMWVTSWAAMVPGAVHVYKGLLLILGVCKPHRKGESCDRLFTDRELEEMARNFLGATQENKTYMSQLGEEHNFPQQIPCVNWEMLHLTSCETSFTLRQHK